MQRMDHDTSGRPPTGPRGTRRWHVLAWLLPALLAGCPLSGKRADSDPVGHGSTDNPAFQVSLTGPGVAPAGPLAYRVTLDAGAGARALTLALTLEGKPVPPAHRPTSSAPSVVRVDGATALRALAPGTARIKVEHASHQATLVIKVEAPAATTGQARVLRMANYEKGGLAEAFRTDTHKGNGGIVNLPEVRAVIIDPAGNIVAGDGCSLFIARVTPPSVPSGHAPLKETDDGNVHFKDFKVGWEGENPEREGCAFPVEGHGFPLTGAGTQEFGMTIHWGCVSKHVLPACGTDGYPACSPVYGADCGYPPLPGGRTTFRIARTAPDV